MCFPVWLKVTDSSVTLLVHICTTRTREGLSAQEDIALCVYRLWTRVSVHNGWFPPPFYSRKKHDGQWVQLVVSVCGDSLCSFTNMTVFTNCWFCRIISVWHRNVSTLLFWQMFQILDCHLACVTHCTRSLSWNESGNQKESSRLILI